MILSRRKVLWGGIGIVTAVGAFGVGRYISEEDLVSVIRRRLDFLHLDEAGLHAFARDQVQAILAKRPTWNRLKYHFDAFVGTVSPSFKRFNRSNERRSRVQQVEDNLVATYLLSSDFFTSGADERRLVRYVAFYDPMRACGNPFARPAIATGLNS